MAARLSGSNGAASPAEPYKADWSTFPGPPKTEAAKAAAREDMDAADEPWLSRAADAIAAADAVVFLSGAGMGVDSGLPDFRGTEGFWKAYPPMKKAGLEFPQVSNPRTFETPAIGWGFFGHRHGLYDAAVPHEGYHIVRRWGEAAKPHGLFAFTSNVDGHLLKAGYPDDRVVECHGSIHFLQCKAGYRCKGDASTGTGRDDIWDGSEELRKLKVDTTTFRADESTIPKCRHCDLIARPNVLMFGDGDWQEWRTEAQEKRMDAWVGTVASSGTPGSRVVLIEVGAGLAVPTVRYTSERLQRKLGATLIRINPREAEGPKGTVSIAGFGLATLAKIDRRLRAGGYDKFAEAEAGAGPAAGATDTAASSSGGSASGAGSA